MLREIKEGMEVIWLDPRKSARDLKCLYKVVKKENDMFLITDDKKQFKVFDAEIENPGDIDMITSVIDECFSWMEQRDLENYKNHIIDRILQDIYSSADENFNGSDVRIALSRMLLGGAGLF